MDAADILTIATQFSQLDVDSIASYELGDMAIAMEQARNALEAASAALLAGLHQRGPWADDGATSGAVWVAARTGGPLGDVRRRQRAGAALRLVPAAAAACRSGRLSPDHQHRLAGCAARHPALAARDEAVLVEHAEGLAARDFAVAARQWCSLAVDTLDAAASDAVEAEQAGWLQVSETLGGRYELSGSLPASQGRIVAAALDGAVDRLLRAARDGDPSVAGRPVAALRADALVDLVAQAMRRGPCDGSVPDRYRVAVVVHADADADRADAETAVAVCDAPAYRAVLSADSEVLDVGRSTSRWPAAVRRAVTLRDLGCVFAGCDRPPSWCDIHHCQPWTQGGDTTVDNGALLCRRHHTFVHAHRWRIVIPKPRGRPETRRPDGTTHTITRWPPPSPPPP